MATAKIVHQFPDETAIVCEVSATNEHPDMLDELVTRCAALYRRAFPDAETDETPDTPDAPGAGA